MANSLYLDLELLSVFQPQHVPSVAIGRPCTDDAMSSIIVDNRAGALAGIQHLYSLGHRRIAFIKGPKALVDSSERWAGVQAFACDAGLAIDPRLVVEFKHRSSSFEEGCRLADTLLKQGRRFTSVMAFDDMTAFGAIRTLHGAGIRVPEDCSVLGFDDIAAAEFYNPPLTTIRQPMEKMGSIAVEVLVESMNATRDRTVSRLCERKITPELVLRQSTAAPAS